jgi:ABC-type Zn uptake system ZnuABC Zn-binding protein ZnuA
MININKELKLIDSNLGMNYTHSIEELWLNPYNYLMMAKNIKNSLSEYISNPYLISNKEKTGIEDKYEELNYELSKLDANYKEIFMEAEYTTIVTDNQLFKFLEKYNIEVISLEENIKTITLTKDDTLSKISKEYNVSISDILTYNNKLDENITVGETIKIPIKTIDSSDVNKVKKLISENNIKYIYSNSKETNTTVSNLIKENKLELVTINTMYSINGNITNTNDNYLTIMNDNLELLKKELNK